MAATDQVVLETEDWDFDPVAFANSGGCELITRDDAFGHWKAEWNDSQINMSPESAVMDMNWRGERLTLVRATMHNCDRVWFIVSKTIVLCEQFFQAVCSWNSSGTGAIAIFEEGYFSRDEELREQIKEKQLSDLVLNEDILSKLTGGVRDFFTQKEWYGQSSIPWKRGVILHGPPGNGKTQTIRALVNELNVSTIYVRSLYDRHFNSEKCLNRIYKRARETAPSIVIMEDVDSLITDRNRSYFLNELDGFRALSGVMTLVTTNHLEKLDVAISNRPSRFDVKIEFPNPSAECRAAYLGESLCLTKLKPEFATQVIKRTKGLSFAGLQEIVRSSIARHMKVMNLENAISQALDEIVGERKVSPSKPKNKKKSSK